MTFIEVLIAAVIVGIILSSMLACLNFASKYAVYNANKLTAIYSAQGVMEEWKNKKSVEPNTVDEVGNPCEEKQVPVSWECEGVTYTDTIYTRRYNY